MPVVRTKLGGCQDLNVFVVPHICDPVLSQASVACSKVYGHLSQLDLADVCLDETLEVDLLLGSGFYRKLATGETIGGENGPVAINTTLALVVLQGGARGAGTPSPNLLCPIPWYCTWMILNFIDVLIFRVRPRVRYVKGMMKKQKSIYI